MKQVAKKTMNRGGTTNKTVKIKKDVSRKPLSPRMKNRNKLKTETAAEKKLRLMKAASQRAKKADPTFKKRKRAKKLAR